MTSCQAETDRILQEICCADSWADVADILHGHRSYYYALPSRDRERLNAQIKDLMSEREGLAEIPVQPTLPPQGTRVKLRPAASSSNGKIPK
jgi:hypothetical protein